MSNSRQTRFKRMWRRTEPCPLVTKASFGISYSVFDDTIDDLNDITEELTVQIISKAREM